MTASFIPPKRILMGPGPSDVQQRVLDAMARPTIGHLDPAFVDMMEEIKALLRMAFQTSNALTFPVSAPASAGMEACFVNLVEPGDKVIVCRNGVFGGRMMENVERAGGVPVDGGRRLGRAGGPATSWRTRSEAIPTRRSSPSCTPRPPPARSPMPKALTEIAHMHGA